MERLSATVLLVLSLGCATTERGWRYIPEGRQTIEPTANVSVAVLPFEDRRGNENENRVMMYLIPLVPYGLARYEVPEGQVRHVTSSVWQFRPPDDFSRAVAQEVENARSFRETFQSNRPSEGDYVLLGDIISTRYEGKIFSYGFSIYGPYLWLLGLPAATHSSELELRLRLAKTPSDPPIWTYTITGSTSQTSRIYAMKSDFEYDTMLKDGMRGALESLRQAAQGLPVAEPSALRGEAPPR